jgi:hypothetical protein
MEKVNQAGKRRRLDDAPNPVTAEIAVEDLTLTVTVNGQTEFNIFVTPIDDKHELIVNGHLYFLGDYSIGMSGLNVVLIWGNSFQLTTTDTLKFRKYITP